MVRQIKHVLIVVMFSYSFNMYSVELSNLFTVETFSRSCKAATKYISTHIGLMGKSSTSTYVIRRVEKTFDLLKSIPFGLYVQRVQDSFYRQVMPRVKNIVTLWGRRLTGSFMRSCTIPVAEERGGELQADVAPVRGHNHVEGNGENAYREGPVTRNQLHQAVLSGDTEMVGFLLRDGEDVNVISDLGNSETPLHIAAQSGNYEMVHFLVTRGADILAQAIAEEGYGITAQEIARRKGFDDIAKFLANEEALLHVAPQAPQATVDDGNIVQETAEDVREYTCPICQETKQAGEYCKLLCGHMYCKEDLEAILRNAVALHDLNGLRCSDPSCRHPFSLTDMSKFTRDKELLAKIDGLQLKEFFATQSQEHLKVCPTPDCSYRFYNEQELRRSVECPDCRKIYCSHCLLPHSEKISCQEARANMHLGEDKNGAERATRECIASTSNPCPRCGTHIEKSAGCNHIKCTLCGYDFCWLCSGQFFDYGHTCPGAMHPTYRD